MESVINRMSHSPGAISLEIDPLTGAIAVGFNTVVKGKPDQLGITGSLDRVNRRVLGARDPQSGACPQVP